MAFRHFDDKKLKKNSDAFFNDFFINFMFFNLMDCKIFFKESFLLLMLFLIEIDWLMLFYGRSTAMNPLFQFLNNLMRFEKKSETFRFYVRNF